MTPSWSDQQLLVFPLHGHTFGQQLSGSAHVCSCPGALLLLGLVSIKLFLWCLQIERSALISSPEWLHPRVLAGPCQERRSCRDSSAPGAPFLLLMFFAAACLRWKRRPRLDGYAPKLVYKSIPCSKIGEDQEEWLAGHMDGRPAIHQHQTNSIKSVEAPLDLYIRNLAVEFRTHHTILVVLHL
jgi:hypothetical protein